MHKATSSLVATWCRMQRLTKARSGDWSRRWIASLQIGFQTCPADAPWTAPNLVERLTMDAEAQGAAVAHDGQQRQNLTLLLRRDAADSLARFYHAGGRAIHRWLDAEDIEHTDLSEIADSFININTPGELAAFRDAVQGASS